jgi:hypothetical protein
MNFDPVVYLLTIAVLLLGVLGLLIWVIVLLARGRRILYASPTGGASPGADPNAAAKENSTDGHSEVDDVTVATPRRTTTGVMVGMALVSIAFVGVIVVVSGTQTLALPLLLIAGIVIFLGALAALVVVFVRSGLSNRNYALGLPDGSIRAIIALSLILLFAILAVFLYIGQGGFGTTIQPTAAQTDIAKQLVTTLSTLVVAIASFYFGSTTVREAKKPPEETPVAPTASPPAPM